MSIGITSTEEGEESFVSELSTKKKQEESSKKGADKKWTIQGDDHYLRDIGIQQKDLDIAVYSLTISPFGEFYLEKIEEGFSFPYKIYGLESHLVDRSIKTFNATKGNMGILLNGQKGTGKTVTAKILCNKLMMPVIVVERKIPGCHMFLNSIQQNVTIFIDEYEKVFGEASEMLTIMDGALNSEYRRMFVLTTNELYVNRNLLQRPGRIRYLKTFNDLSPAIIEEIVNDKLVHVHRKKELIRFISSLEIITVDIVKSLTEEVNIHDENPDSFSEVFNVKKLVGKFDVSEMIPDKEDPLKENFVVKIKNIAISPRPGSYLSEDRDDLVDSYVHIGDTMVGTIVDILDNNTLLVEREKADGVSVRRAIKGNNPRRGVRKVTKALILDETSAKKKKPQMETVIMRFEAATVYHHNYYNYAF